MAVTSLVSVRRAHISMQRVVFVGSSSIDTLPMCLCEHPVDRLACALCVLKSILPVLCCLMTCTCLHGLYHGHVRVCSLQHGSNTRACVVYVF